jgi:hypothetical protein
MVHQIFLSSIKTMARAATISLKQKPGGYINCWQWPMSGGRIDSG